MSAHRHTYALTITWTGSRGVGTRTYDGYARDHTITAAGKPTLLGSSDRTFRGDPTRYNPEDLLVASLSACHMLWYLHLCAEAGIVVTAYEDAASGVMIERGEHGGAFERVILRPKIVVLGPDSAEEAVAIHQEAHHKCFIANSVKFPVEVHPEVRSDLTP